jgi:VWFA-related protein
MVREEVVISRSPHRLPRTLAAAVVLAFLLDPPAGLARQESAPRTLDSDLVEEQVVAVAELVVLVTDRDGRPVADVAGAEVRVLEAGVEQRLAFFEPVSRGRPKPVPGTEAPVPAPVYTPEGEHAAGEPADVLPTRAVRRVVLAFDVRNSRKQVREGWQDAARDWLATGMQPDDRAGIVLLGRYPEWLAEFSDDRPALVGTLEKGLLKRAAPSRDRSRYVTSLADDIRTCLEAESGRVASGDVVDCAYTMARARVPRWNAEARESVANLDALVGQLAAIPGRKVVLLFSEGIVDDPAMIAVYTILDAIGSAGVFPDIHKMKARIGNDVHAELAALQEHARAAGVSFFTLNTKERNASATRGGLEHPTALPARALGVEPWRDMDASTRETLDLLARETGGRSYLGLEELGDQVSAAADSYFGMYTLGYYRADPRAEPGKLRVEIARKGLEVSYADRADREGPAATPARLDISIGAPENEPPGQALPLVVTMAFDDLPLRRAGRSLGTVLGVHLQAVRPDGTIAAERLDIETVAIDRKRKDRAQGSRFVHESRLVLPPGPYRVRARVSDDRQVMIAERSVDLTLAPGEVRPGLDAATTD